MLKLPKQYKDKEILYRRLILFLLFVALFVVYAAEILGFVSKAIWICLPFIIGGLLSFILNSLYKVLLKFGRMVLHQKNPESWQLAYRAATLLVVIGFIALLLTFVIPQIVSSFQKIVTTVPEKFSDGYSRLMDLSKDLPYVQEWLEKNQDLLTNAPALLAELSSFIFAGNAGNALSSVQDVVSNTFSWIWTLFLSLAFSIIAFFNTENFLKESRLIGKAYMPARVYESVHHGIELICQIFSQYLGGTVIECIILATLVSVFTLIFQIPYGLLVGVFCGICALVPMFGATAGAVLCTLFILMESPGKALTFIIGFLCIQQIEGNFIYPNVVGKSVGLPSMYVVVAITIGASLAGILGMIISIPIASVIYAVITEQAMERMDSKETAQDSPAQPKN